MLIARICDAKIVRSMQESLPELTTGFVRQICGATMSWFRPTAVELLRTPTNGNPPRGRWRWAAVPRLRKLYRVLALPTATDRVRKRDSECVEKEGKSTTQQNSKTSTLRTRSSEKIRSLDQSAKKEIRPLTAPLFYVSHLFCGALFIRKRSRREFRIWSCSKELVARSGGGS